MTERKVDTIKACDLCGKVGDCYYDMPTGAGPWANLCEDCKQAQPYTQLGTRFTLRGPKLPTASETLDGEDLSTLESICMDGDREIKCPNCGELRSVEPDASYTYDCEGCDTKVRVPCIM